MMPADAESMPGHQRRRMGMALLWAFLPGTYFSAHYTYYWWGFRTIGRALPFRLWEWQMLHVGVWFALALGCAGMLARAVHRSSATGWRRGDGMYAGGLAMAILAFLFLVDLFQPESERQVRIPGYSALFEAMIEIVLPLLAGTLLLLWLFRIRRGRSDPRRRGRPFPERSP